ncbi:hypothetical protein [Desulfoferrobacter suflitae]|uniref:hypothetical protein n=1 Tax=Desulfoferrobacter suflitae TaxID=2865782 RepID=UPI00216406D7|nr:hypothetical protein [Desulfoferrobacter suflitae]MCK8600091.1 hypothetical protein [Desulfoferrobacter suflitae]
MPFSKKPVSSLSKGPVLSSSKDELSTTEQKLAGALQRLVEDLIDADEHRDPETGELYSSVKFAVETLRQITGNEEVLSDEC